MKKIYLFIDHQQDPKRQSKFRLRVITGTGKNRVELKALYLQSRPEALKMKKHLRDVVSALQEAGCV
jgi:hypothetical protein